VREIKEFVLDWMVNHVWVAVVLIWITAAVILGLSMWSVTVNRGCS
jgi:hypothetical protein